jgi:hypothetical protein
MKRFLMLVFCASSLACQFGTRVGTLTVAHEPTGTAARITLRSGTVVNGELLAVGDTDITMLWSDSVWSMPYARARTMIFTGVPVTLNNGHGPTPTERDRLRLASRFPQGLSPDLEARLLAAHHQTALIGFAP